MKNSYFYQTLVKFIAIICYIYTSVTAASENNLAKQQLIQQGERYVLEQLEADTQHQIDVSAMPIDDRIVIPDCPSDLLFSASPEALKQSNVTVKAQCASNGWYIFMVIKALQTQPVVVISSAVSPGTILTRNNVSTVDMDVKRLRSTTFSSVEEVIGARIKRRVTAGRPVSPQNLCFVCKGDNVVISAGSKSMRVKTSGIAMEDGKVGDTIQVRNSRSNKRIQAKVTSTGQVEVNF
ncbi:flagellar basal body P-ring formation chaperone FlgA [Paraglaciecola sp. 2405UD69-4]|uniref:flagellar basal body P-ring formation chaperone FlgA n=1 Tax=Paraglaciecola sp. 2405UD69-4 TaxID=3391836 RepID=UPI0039C908F7